MERIAQAKSELVAALPLYGLAVLNGDDPRVRDMSGCSGANRVLYYGLSSSNDLWADEPQVLGLQGIRLTMHLGGDCVEAQVPLLGRHSVYAALAASAVGLYAGMSWSDIVAGLADRRAQVRLCARPGIRGATILDDSYNASPASMIAALDLLSEMNGRRIAVLGGMLELGSYAEEGHRVVGRRAAQTASILLAVGELGKLMAQEALQSGMEQQNVLCAADVAEAVQRLGGLLTRGDFVLVKASHGVALDQVVRQITDSAEAECGEREP
jgi:UDP-N-acetylmuramoyl-tripeptide--D-alanyl-D-alanine ligase